MKRYFYRASDKRFWSIEDKGTSYNISYGVEYLGRERFGSKSFSSIETCQKNIEKEIQKKMDDNYEEITILEEFSGVSTMQDVWEIQKALKEQPLKYHLNISPPILIKALSRITSIEELTLRNVSQLPDEIQQLHNLKKLNINFNPNSKGQITNSLGNMESLQELNLENVFSIENFGNLENLKKLNIGFWNEGEGIIPQNIDRLKKLTYLRLFYAKQIPDTVYELKNLEELVFTYSEVKELPDTIENLDKLKKLELDFMYTNLMDKPLTLPHSFGNLGNLDELTIRWRKVENLPESFKSFAQLKN